MVTLDSLKLGRCTLIKVDVEGMERQVLEGAAKTIAACLPILYVENDRREKAAELVRYIDGLGYAMYWHLPPLFNPNNFLQNPDNVFGNIVSANVSMHSQKHAPHARWSSTGPTRHAVPVLTSVAVTFQQVNTFIKTAPRVRQAARFRRVW